MGIVCKIEGRKQENGQAVHSWLPCQTGSVYLLLSVHVQQKVGNTVAVAKLVVIPGEEGKKDNGEMVPSRKALLLGNGRNIRKPHQEMSLTKLSLREMPAPASKMEEWESPMKSEETTCKIKVQTQMDAMSDVKSDWCLRACWNDRSPGPRCNPALPSWVRWPRHWRPS